MSIRPHLLILSTLLGPVAFAQSTTPNDSTGAVPSLGGPVVDGVCLLSREAVLTNTKLGQAVETRLQVLAREAQTEVDAERAPIETDLHSFQVEQGSMSAQELQDQKQALDARLEALRAKAAQRSRELQVTRAKALQRVDQEARPVIADVYKSRKCGLLIDRNTVLGGNLSNDLTNLVIQALDSRVSTFMFDRETLPSLGAGSR